MSALPCRLVLSSSTTCCRPNRVACTSAAPSRASVRAIRATRSPSPSASSSTGIPSIIRATMPIPLRACFGHAAAVDFVTDEAAADGALARAERRKSPGHRLQQPLAFPGRRPKHHLLDGSRRQRGFPPEPPSSPAARPCVRQHGPRTASIFFQDLPSPASLVAPRQPDRGDSFVGLGTQASVGTQLEPPLSFQRSPGPPTHRVHTAVRARELYPPKVAYEREFQLASF
jgi:hypothetical protein